MLEPDNRRHLFESLKPPAGYDLDYAVGTTYSLDLNMLLAIPMAFTFFDWEDENGRLGTDQMAVLEAIRRYANRISIFCQRGNIAVPHRSQQLYVYLEESVFEAIAPNAGGSFHPKLWVLRFISPEPMVRYRVLCLSRNLTFDRSWDTMLALEGNLLDRRRNFGANRPLGDFIASLPDLALRDLPGEAAQKIDRIQDELRRVEFDLPDGFKEYKFWPLGIEGHRKWPFQGRIDRMLIISPFISEGCLERLIDECGGCVLVSRLGSLEALAPKLLDNFERVCLLMQLQ